MKVLVIDVAAESGGAKSILLEFYNYLKNSCCDDIEWTFVLSKPLFSSNRNINVEVYSEIKKNWLYRLKFDCYTVGKLAKKYNADIVLNMQNTCAIWCKSPQYVYVHQPIPFQKVKKFSFAKKEERIYAVYQYIIGTFIKMSIKKASKVFVQTKWMYREVCKITDSEKIYILPPDIFIEKTNKKMNISFSSFFYPASPSIYKNHECIVKAVTELNQEGITDFDVTFTLQEGSIQKNNIVCVGAIPHEQIFDFYREKIMVFPSYIETFGMPLAEARLSKGIIFAADTEFSREILNGYENAYFFDPFSPEELKKLMHHAINGEMQYIEPKNDSQTVHNSWEELVECIKSETKKCQYTK